MLKPPSERTRHLGKLDHAHIWHPFTQMNQWIEDVPVIIERGEGPYIFDCDGNRYIDGVSSLWCNVHGHRVPRIDQAIRQQLDRIAHTTLLGLSSPPAVEFAAMLAGCAPGGLNRVFYSDSGATALEVGFKMAVGYWYHRGQPSKHQFIGLAGAYHGDTAAAMSVGYSDLFHLPFRPMLFPVRWMPSPDPVRLPDPVRDAYRRASCERCGRNAGEPCAASTFPSRCPLLAERITEYVLAELRALLEKHSKDTAAIVLEPLMQGAAGMIGQPPVLLRGIARLAREFDVLVMADEVATGFGRTGTLFACEQEYEAGDGPDILCLAKGISGGYLPLAATLCTDEVEGAFRGRIEDRRTLFHGHTYTGNPLACAAAIASLELFNTNRLLEHIQESARRIGHAMTRLESCPHVLDVRQKGIMAGIEIGRRDDAPEAFDFTRQVAREMCMAMRSRGLMLRPLGNVLVLMPIPAMAHDLLDQMLDIIVETIETWKM
ncbi:MAG: aspartate aminotransferase family protein [Phycisphaeraceae bacterium]|nr:aspartate aminotransferase family protein [Phycisphaeraceae bacterium]